MKVINVPRVYVDEKNEMELIYKKIYLMKNKNGHVLKFPIENEENEKITELYEIEAGYITELFKELNDNLKNGCKENLVFENDKIVLEFLMDDDLDINQLVIASKELGEEYEDIIDLTYLKEENKITIDDQSFGLEILEEISSNELTEFFDLI